MHGEGGAPGRGRSPVRIAPQSVDLSSRGITHFLGGRSYDVDLSESFRRITNLDISRNPFSDVCDMLRACAAGMPRLACLDLRGCDMSAISAEIIQEKLPERSVAFPSLRRLNLDSAMIGWDALKRLSSRMPALEEVILSRNGLKSLPGARGASNLCRSLRYLDLTWNRIDSWAGLCSDLADFKKLEVLVLTNNQIQAVEITQDAPPSLRVLHLDRNRIASLNDLTRLNDLPALRNLHLLQNPLLSEFDPADARMVKIALLEHIKLLEGSAVTEKERTESELFYLWHCEKSFAAEMEAKRLVDVDGFLSLHPKYIPLCDKYDRDKITEAYPGGRISQTPWLRPRLFKLKVKFPEESGAGPQVITIPLSMKVCELKILVERLLGGSPRVSSLWLETHAPKTVTDLSDLDSHTLDSFYLECNSVIHTAPPP